MDKVELRGVSKNPGFFYRFTKDSNVDPAEVSKNHRILLANLLQSSRSTLSRGSFLTFLAFKEGMLSTLISVLGGWPTVSGRLRAAEAITQEENCLQR